MFANKKDLNHDLYDHLYSLSNPLPRRESQGRIQMARGTTTSYKR